MRGSARNWNGVPTNPEKDEFRKDESREETSFRKEVNPRRSAKSAARLSSSAATNPGVREA
jgi:hypothetical protein